MEWLLLVLLSFGMTACSSLPAPKHANYFYPKADAFSGNVQRPYLALGVVRSKVNYPSLDPGREEADLCRNYYNKAVRDLVRMSKDRGGNAVIDVKSVVFLEDGRREVYPTPECSDDGMEGQVLTQGIAIKWKEPSPEQKDIPSGRKAAALVQPDLGQPNFVQPDIVQKDFVQKDFDLKEDK